MHAATLHLPFGFQGLLHEPLVLLGACRFALDGLDHEGMRRPARCLGGCVDSRLEFRRELEAGCAGWHGSQILPGSKRGQRWLA
jgi:hypothetical protein